MVAPRKFRNAEERAHICAEVEEKLQQLPLSDEEKKNIEAVLMAFVSQTQGGVLEGVIELNSIQSRLEYILPGRRIMHHMMRIVPLQKNERNVS